jgi:hypothetical protein
VAPTLTVVGDSVIVANWPFGDATIQVTRPDATTGKPVAIGLFSGSAQGSLPFTVNTTVPNALAPNGDCWQRGALSQALTPDIRPGDTVTVASDPGAFGGAPSSMSAVVPADGPGGDTGPIPSCSDDAPFARNAATTAPATVTGGAITISGVAQPLATGVSISAGDGTRSTAPVDATPAADGSWSATIPAGQAGTLANGPLTVQPVFAVPDVATGAPAHIEGAPISLQKQRSDGQAAGGGAGAGKTGGSAPQPGSGSAGSKGAGPQAAKLTVRSPLSLAIARRNGLSASFVVPRGARVVDTRLSFGGRVLLRRVDRARSAGARQTVRFHGAALRRVLRRAGRYTLAVRTGSSRNRLGTPLVGAVRVSQESR